MTAGYAEGARKSGRTAGIRRWPLLVAAIVLPLLVMWFRVVHQDDEILALVRNEVVETAGSRSWTGSFVNTNERHLREVAVTVAFLDGRNGTIGTTHAEAAELPSGGRLELRAPLPSAAVRLRIQSVQWRMDTSTADRWLRGITTSARIGPFREPWEFGYVMGRR